MEFILIEALYYYKAIVFEKLRVKVFVKNCSTLQEVFIGVMSAVTDRHHACREKYEQFHRMILDRK